MNTIKILVADDHEGFRHSLSSFLRTQEGVEIIGEASDGIEAVNLTEKLHPDLVLMDLAMPKRNGFEATKDIKERSPETRVIVLSMHSGETYKQMALLNRADGFIEKGALKLGLLTLLRNECARAIGFEVGATAA
ncbi:MAG: response regulator transcription factor [Ignavibacteriales bacterium]|nr:response regulator transcription factor [Ignavibacteriales bacterium]